MSRRASVTGIIVVTVCVTSSVIVAGWFAASQYLGPQAVGTPHAAASAAPAPRMKPARASANKKTRGKSQENRLSNDPAPASLPEAADNDAARALDDNEPSSLAEGSLATPAESASPRGEESESAGAPLEGIASPKAADNHGDARAIMEEAQRRAEAKSYRYDGLLQSFDTKGKVAEKRWKFDRFGSHGQSKAVLRFTAPPEVKGVALLIENHPERASDQWMWTPAIERDRRIAMQDRSTRFFGTDFSFEDLEERDIDQYDYEMLGDETIERADCWKIQSTPRESRSSVYSRSIVWVRKDNYAFARLDNFVKNEVVKRLAYSNIENIQGIWTARQLEMADLRRGSRTRLTLQQVTYNVPMKKDDFTLQAIRR